MKSYLIIASVGIAAVMGPGNRSAAHMSDYTLTITGQCPGRATIHWSGATPNRTQVVLFGYNEGKFIIPWGRCEGAVLAIRNIRVARIMGTESGEGMVSFSMGSCCCARPLQLIEVGSCNVSNAAHLP